MTSAFAQHKLVQKPLKQHRFDCLASKLHSSRVAHLNWPVTGMISELEVLWSSSSADCKRTAIIQTVVVWFDG